MYSLRAALAAVLFGQAIAAPTERAANANSVVFDGRVLSTTTGANFDAGNTVYDPKYDLGANLTWSDVLLFPQVSQSRFDNASTKAVEVTINDKSIFTPSATNVQAGFRRAELLPAVASDDYVSGVKTLHFSLQSDTKRALNFSHEYQLVWQESQDYSADQWTVGTGALFGNGDNQTTIAQSKVLYVRGTSGASPQQTLWQTPFTDGVWHNFALQLNYNSNQIQVFYSQGSAALKAVTSYIPNDLSNLGKFHWGILKKPTGTGLSDITRQGFQESGINEGIIYGGIFEENTLNGNVTLCA